MRPNKPHREQVTISEITRGGAGLIEGRQFDNYLMPDFSQSTPRLFDKTGPKNLLRRA